LPNHHSGDAGAITMSSSEADVDMAIREGQDMHGLTLTVSTFFDL